MVRCKDPGRVNRGKGYGAVNWLDYSVAIRDVDGIYSGSGVGRSQQPPLMMLGLILVVDRAAQYVIYGGPRFRRELPAGRCSFNCRDEFSSADCLQNISPKVDGSD